MVGWGGGGGGGEAGKSEKVETSVQLIWVRLRRNQDLSERVKTEQL